MVMQTVPNIEWMKSERNTRTNEDTDRERERERERVKSLKLFLKKNRDFFFI